MGVATSKYNYPIYAEKGRISPMKGKAMSPESRLKMSLAHKKRKLELDNSQTSDSMKG